MPSVSTVVQRFEPEVDWDTIRVKKAQKAGVDPEWLKRQWRENNLRSTSNGTIVHEFGEACMYFFQGRFDEIAEYTKHRQIEDGYLIPYGPKQTAASKLYEDILLNYNIWPVMPEAKVYTGLNDTLHLKEDYCGTFDLLFAGRGKDGKIRPFLLDWKKYLAIDNDGTIWNDDRTSRFSSSIDERHPRSYRGAPAMIDIPSKMEINQNHAEVYRNGSKGADWKVPLKRNMGNKIGNAVGETLGCIFSIIIIAIFIAIVSILLSS